MASFAPAIAKSFRMSLERKALRGIATVGNLKDT